MSTNGTHRISESVIRQALSLLRHDLSNAFTAERIERDDLHLPKAAWIGVRFGMQAESGHTLEKLLEELVRPLLVKPIVAPPKFSACDMSRAPRDYSNHTAITKIDEILIMVGSICLILGHNPLSDTQIINQLRSKLNGLLNGGQ